MLALLPRYSGNIVIDEENIRGISAKQMSRKTAYIPQFSAQTFNYSVRDVVLMGTTSLVGGFSSPGKKELECADMALENLNISNLKGRMFMNISGGERQLVLIARALAQHAGILIMDEPTANLDYGNQVHVLEQIQGLTKQGYTVIPSTHDPDQAFMYADDVKALSMCLSRAFMTMS